MAKEEREFSVSRFVKTWGGILMDLGAQLL
jgi:hypothetical protein